MTNTETFCFTQRRRLNMLDKATDVHKSTLHLRINVINVLVSKLMEIYRFRLHFISSRSYTGKDSLLDVEQLNTRDWTGADFSGSTLLIHFNRNQFGSIGTAVKLISSQYEFHLPWTKIKCALNGNRQRMSYSLLYRDRVQFKEGFNFSKVRN